MKRTTATRAGSLSTAAIINDQPISAILHNPQLPGAPFYLAAPGPAAALLFHGFTATCSEVAHLGQVLHQHGITAVGPLLPGHGTTPAALNRARWQDWTDAAEAAYAELARRYPRVIVGGESNGALVALYLAARHPEIAAVLAFAPALRLRMSGVERLVLNLLAPLNIMLPKGDLSGDTTWQGYTVNPLRGVQQILRLQEVVGGLLPQVCQPVLIVQGRLDHTIDPHSAEVVFQQVGSTTKELHWLEESGHCVLIDAQKDETERLALAFLEQVGALPAE